MTLPLEYLVRHEATKLLRRGAPGRFLCLTCLEKALRLALGAAHTKGRVERALRTVSRFPRGRVHLQARFYLRSVRQARPVPERQMIDETEKGHRSFAVSRRLQSSGAEEFCPGAEGGTGEPSGRSTDLRCLPSGMRAGQVQNEFIANDRTKAAAHTRCL